MLFQAGLPQSMSMARTRSSRLGGFFSVRLDGPCFSAMIRFIRSGPCSSGGCAYSFLFFSFCCSVIQLAIVSVLVMLRLYVQVQPYLISFF